MNLLLPLLLVPLIRADPIQLVLPADAPPGHWEEAVRLAGVDLEIGSCTPCDRVELSEEGSQWVVVLRSATGQERGTLELPSGSSAYTWAALFMEAESRLRPMSGWAFGHRPTTATQSQVPVVAPPVVAPPVVAPPVVAPPVVAPPVVAPPVVAPPVVAPPVEAPPIEEPPIEEPPIEAPLVEPSPVEPSPVEPSPVEPSPVEPLPVEPPPVEAPPVEASPVEPSPAAPLILTLGLGLQEEYRSGCTPASGLAGEISLSTGSTWRAGVSFSLRSQADLPSLESERGYTARDLGLGVWWNPVGGLEIGARGALSWRRFFQQDRLLTSRANVGLIPSMGVDLGYGFPVGPLVLGPRILTRYDVRQTLLVVGADTVGTLAPLAVDVGLMMDWSTDIQHSEFGSDRSGVEAALP